MDNANVMRLWPFGAISAMLTVLSYGSCSVPGSTSYTSIRASRTREVSESAHPPSY